MNLEHRILIALFKKRTMSLSELRRSFHRVKLSDRDVALSTLHEQGYIICERSLSKTSSKIITIYRISNMY